MDRIMAKCYQIMNKENVVYKSLSCKNLCNMIFNSKMCESCQNKKWKHLRGFDGSDIHKY